MWITSLIIEYIDSDQNFNWRYNMDGSYPDLPWVIRAPSRLMSNPYEHIFSMLSNMDTTKFNSLFEV